MQNTEILHKITQKIWHCLTTVEIKKDKKLKKKTNQRCVNMFKHPVKEK